jgi:hypothetical protein
MNTTRRTLLTLLGGLPLIGKALAETQPTTTPLLEAANLGNLEISDDLIFNETIQPNELTPWPPGIRGHRGKRNAMGKKDLYLYVAEDWEPPQDQKESLATAPTDLVANHPDQKTGETNQAAPARPATLAPDLPTRAVPRHEEATRPLPQREHEEASARR